jgi:hypothetical protein
VKLKRKQRKRNIKGTTCLNCGMPLQGDENFCSYCGQKNDIRKPDFSNYFSNFFDNFFSFDSKVFITLKDLVFKPGFYAKEYINGKRARYVNPFKLLLNVSVIYFILYNVLDPFIDSDQELKKQINNKEAGVVTDTIVKKKRGVTSNSRDLVNYTKLLDSLFEADHLQQKLTDKMLSDKEKDSIYNDILFAIGTQFKKKDKTRIDNKKGKIKIDKGIVKVNFSLNKKPSKKNRIVSRGNKIVSLYRLEEYLKNKETPFPSHLKAATAREIGNASMFTKFNHYQSISNYDDFDDYEPKELMEVLGLPYHKSDVFIIKGAKNIKTLTKGNKNIKDFGNKIISKITISLFFILPFFTLFFTAFYSGKDTTYTNNLILVFNIQTVFFVMMLTLIIIELLTSSLVSIGLGLWVLKVSKWITIILFILYVFYIYKSLRYCFKQNRFLTIVKQFFIMFLYGFLAMLGFIFITFISLFF